MKLAVDRARCIGAGMCALTAPEIFDQDTTDGRVLLLDPEPQLPQHTPAREAAHICPAAAITVHDRPPSDTGTTSASDTPYDTRGIG